MLIAISAPPPHRHEPRLEGQKWPPLSGSHAAGRPGGLRVLHFQGRTP